MSASEPSADTPFVRGKRRRATAVCRGSGPHGDGTLRDGRGGRRAGRLILEVLDRAQDDEHRGDKVANEAPFETGKRSSQVGLGDEPVVRLAHGLDDRLGLTGVEPGRGQALDCGVRVERGRHGSTLTVPGPYAAAGPNPGRTRQARHAEDSPPRRWAWVHEQGARSQDLTQRCSTGFVTAACKCRYRPVRDPDRPTPGTGVDRNEVGARSLHVRRKE